LPPQSRSGAKAELGPVRILLLRSDVGADAPPDELDTLTTADAVATALEQKGHAVATRAFVPDALTATVWETRAELVFNLVESVFGQGDLAGMAAAMLAQRRVPYTGSSAAALASAADKCFTKRVLRASGLPTPDWCEAPHWSGLSEDLAYVVKAVDEDASVGLDDAAVVRGADAVRARAKACGERHGGRWFAEVYCPGREFNVSLIERNCAARVLPIAETKFEGWASDRPLIVGYAAKWYEDSPDCVGTPRAFGVERESPALAEALTSLAMTAWHLLNLQGYARVDFRLDMTGAPTILEANPNPCLEPHAGFAAAAARAGIGYADLVEQIAFEAIRFSAAI
jgi:D-alanine-D-alanine ligase